MHCFQGALESFVFAMGPPPLRLPEGMKVKFFGSARNTNGVGKYLVPTPRFGLDGVAENPLLDVTHVSETRLSKSLSRPAQHPAGYPGSEPSITSPIAPLPSSSTAVFRSTKKRKGKALDACSEVQPEVVNAKRRRTKGRGVSAATRR